MNWIKRLFGVKEKTQQEIDLDNRFLAEYHRQKIKESPYRARTVFDIKFGRLYNTGSFHTKMPNDKK